MADNDVIMQVGNCVRTKYKYFWGRSIQEMGGNVVIGRSIYGVVVIDRSLYSRFYGIVDQLKPS